MSEPKNAVKTFTVDALQWQPWVATVDVANLTPAQTEVLSEAPGGLEKIGPYYALLAHDAEVLRERTRLFNAVMYGRGGLPRRDRELSSVAGSRVNGCTYCASVHGRIYNDLTKRTDVIQRIFDEGVNTSLEQRERAIVDFSVLLTRNPEQVTAASLEPLRRAGLSEAEILDLIHVVAMFAWANRLLQTLGHPTRDEVVLS